MAGTTAWILGDQLSTANPALRGADRALIVESRAQLRRGRPHRRRLHLTLSAMRHFAEELGDRMEVDYRRAESMRAGVEAHRSEHAPDEIVVLTPSSVPGHQRLLRLPGLTRRPGSLFLTDRREFEEWAEGRERIVMGDFYRWQRRRLDVLMDGTEPEGGRWSFDAENRRPPPADARPPRPYRPREDDIDEAVRRDLDALDLDCFGGDGPRLWPATRAEARRSLDRFVETRLERFGPWQDAMLHGERFMWHSLVSTSLNLGLLSPRECVEAVERAYREGDAPLPSAEGFIRQIIGWREYVWLLHWRDASDRAGANALLARAPVPAALWGGETSMRCVADAVGGLRRTGYAHHIERLMLFGNLMLLSGARPAECLEWFRGCFIDGNDWVMDANVLGMATYADGGRVATKPYAAGGGYIDRMSDHCGGCAYDPRARVGEAACPFTTLYWDFLDRQRDRLSGNHRMKLVYGNLDRIDENELEEIRARARRVREGLKPGAGRPF